MNPVLGTGLVEGEGPVVMPDGRVWAVEMAGSRATVAEVGRTGDVIERIKVGGRPNGMTIDGDGRLWVAEARSGRVLCYAEDGTLVRAIEHPDSRFLWPNDLRFGPDGHLYLTDSGVLDTTWVQGLAINPDFATLPLRGTVYEIDVERGRVLRRFGDGIRFANGVAFGPDDLLYVNETLSGKVFRYDVLGVSSPDPEEFGTTYLPDDDHPLWSGPDGMAFGSDGRLYCTVYGRGRISVLDRNGSLVGTMPTNGSRPTNIAFDRDRDRAYVTEVERSCVEVVSMPCAGLPLHRPMLDL